MKSEPLFLRVANGHASLVDAATALASSADNGTAATAGDILSGAAKYPHDFAAFSGKFRGILVDLMDNGITPAVREGLNSYMEPSLSEVTTGSSWSTKGSSSEYPVIKDKDMPWAEALVCYNLCKYIKAFGVQELKTCKKCKKFFAGRGKYASYCSDSCREGKT